MSNSTTYSIYVHLKGDGPPAESPRFGTKEEAEAELDKIRAVLNSTDDPGLNWLVVTGDEIRGANIKAHTPPSLPAVAPRESVRDRRF